MGSRPGFLPTEESMEIDMRHDGRHNSAGMLRLDTKRLPFAPTSVLFEDIERILDIKADGWLTGQSIDAFLTWAVAMGECNRIAVAQSPPPPGLCVHELYIPAQLVASVLIHVSATSAMATSAMARAFCFHSG